MSEGYPKQVIKEVLPTDSEVQYADGVDPVRQKWKENVMRCKMICLHKLELPLTTNPTYMKKEQKQKLIKMVESQMLEDEDEILTEFNKLVCDELLHQDADYSNYPIYCQPNEHKIVEIERSVATVTMSDDEEEWERRDEAKKIEYYEIDCGGNEIPMSDDTKKEVTFLESI